MDCFYGMNTYTTHAVAKTAIFFLSTTFIKRYIDIAAIIIKLIAIGNVPSFSKKLSAFL